MATYSPEMLYKKMNDVQETFGALAQTSQFMISLNLARSSEPGTLQNWLTTCGLFKETSGTSETYDFMCSEATLPGSTYDMAENSGDRQGVLERFPIRRIFTDFDLTFYVDKEYNTIRIFEEWMNWIDPLNAGTNVYSGSESGQNEGFNQERNSFYRFRYPDSYKTNINIIKFERNFLRNPNSLTSDAMLLKQPILNYTFIDAFPMNISAIPFSYEGTQITKLSVNFSYTRYTVSKQNPEDQV